MFVYTYQKQKFLPMLHMIYYVHYMYQPIYENNLVINNLFMCIRSINLYIKTI